MFFVLTATFVNPDVLTSSSRVRSVSCENIVVKVDATCKQTPPVIPVYLAIVKKISTRKKRKIVPLVITLNMS